MTLGKLLLWTAAAGVVFFVLQIYLRYLLAWSGFLDAL